MYVSGATEERHNRRRLLQHTPTGPISRMNASRVLPANGPKEAARQQRCLRGHGHNVHLRPRDAKGTERPPSPLRESPEREYQEQVLRLICSPTLRRAWPRDGPEAAICVQGVDVQCVLQFTLIHAAGCALHRRTSRVIHRSKLFSRFEKQLV